MQMDTMSEEEWTSRKYEIGRSFFSNLQSNYDDDSVPERSSSLWVDISASSLSPKRIYTPLPDLLYEVQNPHDDRESFYERLEERTIKYVSAASDTVAGSDMYTEGSFEQSFTEQQILDSSLEKGADSVSKIIETIQQSKRKARKSEAAQRKLKFEFKKLKVDASVQTECSSYNKNLPTSLKSDVTARKKVWLDLKQGKFLVGNIDIYNICGCGKHKCE